MSEKICDYCHGRKSIFTMETISSSSWGWGDDETKICLKEAENNMDRFEVFIDRGFLRLVEASDSECLDHGNKIAIAYCPMCGRKFSKMEKAHE
jgi:hypothetical protein